MNLFALGAGIIGLLCGGILVYIFGLGPLAYIISAAVHKVEGRNYLKALGVFGLSIVANVIIHLILKQLIHGFLLWFLAVLVDAAVAILFVCLFYHVGFGKAVTVWLLAFAILIGIGFVLVLFGLIFGGIALKDTIQNIIQQYSLVIALV